MLYSFAMEIEIENLGRQTSPDFVGDNLLIRITKKENGETKSMHVLIPVTGMVADIAWRETNNNPVGLNFVTQGYAGHYI